MHQPGAFSVSLSLEPLWGPRKAQRARSEQRVPMSNCRRDHTTGERKYTHKKTTVCVGQK